MICGFVRSAWLLGHERGLPTRICVVWCHSRLLNTNGCWRGLDMVCSSLFVVLAVSKSKFATWCVRCGVLFVLAVGPFEICSDAVR